MQNKLFGATIIPGASYLDTKAILNIQEGFVIGSSTEYLNIGDYEVESIVNSGPFDQTLQLSASAPHMKLSSMDNLYGRKLLNRYSFFDNFDNNNSLGTNYSVSADNWSYSSNDLICSSPPERSFLFHTNDFDISAVKVVVNFRADKFSTGANFGIGFNLNDANTDELDGYLLNILGSTNVIELARIDNSVYTSLQTASFTPGNSTNYWLILTSRLGRIHGYISTDGIGTSTYINFSDSRYQKGGVALAAGALSGSIYRVHRLEIDEIGSQYDNLSVINETVGMGGLAGVTSEDLITNLSSFDKTSGSSWVLSDGTLDLVNTASGSSWHVYISDAEDSMGASLIDFVLQAKVRGTSGNMAGLIFGTSFNDFYGNYFRFGPSNADSNIAEKMGSTRHSLQGRGTYINLLPNTDYSLKLIKSGDAISWYVNDVMSNSTYGSSFNTFNVFNSFLVGFFGFRNGVAGTTTRFTNIEISRIATPIEDTNFEPNNPVSSNLDRYLDEGIVYNYRNNGLDYFKMGVSRGTHGVSDSSRFFSSDNPISNIRGSDITIARSDNILGLKTTENTRLIRQGDSIRATFITDQNIKNTSTAISKAEASSVVSAGDIQTPSISLPARPIVEVYDRLTFRYGLLGVSDRFTVGSQTKSYNSKSGRFTQRITLLSTDV